MELTILFAFSLFSTAFAYLIVPYLVGIIGRKKGKTYELSFIKKFVIINGACVWFIFQIIRIYTDNIGTSAAVFIWSAVAYWLMKKLIYKPSEESGEQTAARENDHYNEPIDPFRHIRKKDKRQKNIIVMLSILLFLSVSFNINQANEITILEYSLEEATQKSEELKQKQSEYKEQKEYEQEKLAFFDEYIVWVEDDGSNHYHKYDCHKFKGNSFWAYNVDNAKHQGYKPCPICCED